MRSVSPARGTLLLSTLLLAASFALAQEPPAPPEPPEKPQIDDEDMEPPEAPHKEISLKGIHVRDGETHHGDISAIAPSGLIEGTQDGDVYMWSGPLRITGTVNGDVFFFGSQLDVTGTITKSLPAAC